MDSPRQVEARDREGGMICAHLGCDGHWHVVQSESIYIEEQQRVCGGCWLIICPHHPDCAPGGE